MKTIEVTFELMKNNIKKNYKIMIAVMALCIIIGVVVGIVMAYSYDPVKSIDKKQIQEHVGFQSLDRDGGYYYNAFFSLKEKNDYIKVYLTYFEQVDLSAESRNEIAMVEEKIFDYQEDFTDARTFFNANAPCLVGEVDSAIEFYTKKIELLEKTKEKTIAELDEVVNGKYTDDYKESRQKALSQDILGTEEDINMFAKWIDILKNSTQDEIAQKSVKADLVLEENREKLNQIIDDFDNTMENISRNENYEIVYNKRLLNEYSDEGGFDNELDQEEVLNNKKGQAIIYARSIAGLDIKKERFLAALTFFILFGVIVSIIAGSVYMPEKGKK